jgi:hypothetical protein
MLIPERPAGTTGVDTLDRHASYAVTAWLDGDRSDEEGDG